MKFVLIVLLFLTQLSLAQTVSTPMCDSWASRANQEKRDAQVFQSAIQIAEVMKANLPENFLQGLQQNFSSLQAEKEKSLASSEVFLEKAKKDVGCDEFHNEEAISVYASKAKSYQNIFQNYSTQIERNQTFIQQNGGQVKPSDLSHYKEYDSLLKAQASLFEAQWTKYQGLEAEFRAIVEEMNPSPNNKPVKHKVNPKARGWDI